MDRFLSAAAEALKAGNPLQALKWVGFREEAEALALRGIAMAQLEEFVQARELLKQAARAFGVKDPVARARCLVAQAEIAFVSRDLSWPVGELEAARAVLEKCGDRLNAAHARHLQARRSLLLGRLGEAERALSEVDPDGLPPLRRAAHELIVAGLGMRRLRSREASEAFVRARAAARQSGIPALMAEVEKAARLLEESVARLLTSGGEKLLLLGEVEALLQSRILVIDACRHLVRSGPSVIPLASRPVLFALVRALAEAWPADVSRSELASHAFQARQIDESHRARLRVEIGRLRKLTAPVLEIRATARGFAIRPRRAREVAVLTWPGETENAEVLALLSDGEAWSSSALALALGLSPRTILRSLNALAEAGKVQWFGRGRARRWTLPSVSGFSTILLLPAPFENP